MKLPKLMLAFLSFFLFAGYLLNAQNFQYPATDKRPVTDTYFGKTVTDDYRWLEDVNSEEVKNWLKAQGDYTNNWLEKIPGRNALIEDFKKFDALRPATINGIKREANRYFYKKTLSGEALVKFIIATVRMVKNYCCLILLLTYEARTFPFLILFQAGMVRKSH